MRQEMASEQVAAVVALARSAGDAIMAVYRAGDVAWAAKADASPVCQADLIAHEILVAGLTGLSPGLPVVSEEGSRQGPASPPGGQFWLIDPLDGTKEFISGNDEFTVNVALIDNGRPVVGVVVAPALGLSYWGVAGTGAYRIDPAGPVAIRAEPPPEAHALRVVASRSHLDAQTQAFIASLGPCQLLRAGSSLKMCRIAENAADIYPRLGPTCEWDTAAAQAVLEAAGGTVRTLSGQALRYGKPEMLNPFFVASAPGVMPVWTAVQSREA